MQRTKQPLECRQRFDHARHKLCGVVGFHFDISGSLGTGYEPSQVDGAVGFEGLENCMSLEVAFQGLRIPGRKDSAVKQEVVVESNETDGLAGSVAAPNLVDERSVVGDAVGAFEPLVGYHAEQFVEVIADGKQLAFPLLVGGRLVQVELKLLLNGPAVLWSAQERQDSVQPGVSLHDVAELLIVVEEDVVRYRRAPRFLRIDIGQCLRRALFGASGERRRQVRGRIVGRSGAEDDHQHVRSITDGGVANLAPRTNF